jgi:hypothetical protein
MTRPTSIAFTGSSKKLTAKERDIVEESVKGIGGEPALFFSGGAVGVDLWAAEVAIRSFGDSKHVVIIPQWAPAPNRPPRPCQRDRDGLKRLSTVAAELGVYLRYDWSFVGIGKKEAVGFRRRNEGLVLNCTHLMAYPKKLDRYRSGTWMTINYAVEYERPVKITPLNGDAEEVLR